MVKIDWVVKAKGLIKSEIKKKNMTYEQLSIKLESMGINETPENINNKINRGKFSAVFLIQVLSAIETKKINIED